MNFQVELHNFCNFSCGYCPHKDMERKKEFMSDEVWKTILNEYIIPYRHINTFSPPTFVGHKDTEPLIDKTLPTKLRSLPSDMKIDIYSNGVLLPKWHDRGQDFINFLASLPNQVRFMMSDHPFNYDYSVNDYGPTVKYLLDVLRNPPPNVEFITVSHKSKWVDEELQDAWKMMWKGLPITVHCNTHINPWTGRMEDIATCHYNGCPYADFGHLFIGVTGNIIACCLDLEEEIVLGNVLCDDSADMFAKTEAFYADQRYCQEIKERPKHRVCDNCYGYDRLVPLGVRIA